jgi:hypothetical protein
MLRAFALFLSVPLFGLGCGDFSADGSDKSGSLFNVEYIDPTYFEESTRQVDVALNPNCSNDAEAPDPEPFSDHFADVTFTNRALNNSLETPPTIYLDEYEVWYEPLTLGSPPLPRITVTPIRDHAGIDPCDPGSQCSGETLSQIQFVPVEHKGDLYDSLYGPGGTCDFLTGAGICQLEYNIYYRFFGTNDYGYEVSADGSTNFYAANYDNCGGG